MDEYGGREEAGEVETEVVVGEGQEEGEEQEDNVRAAGGGGGD